MNSLSCQHYEKCGGCQGLDIPYTMQLERKQLQLKELCKEWTYLTIPPVIPSPQPTYYRHKVQLPFGTERIKGVQQVTLGCYGHDSHVVINQKMCLVQDKDLSTIAWTIREIVQKLKWPVYDEFRGQGFLRHVLLRKGAGTGEILIGLVTNGERPKSTRAIAQKIIDLTKDKIDSSSSIVGVVQNVNTRKTNVVLGTQEFTWWGRPFLKERLGPFTFHVGLSTFFQVNPFQTPNLYNEVLRWVPENAKVLDVYCGVGSITLWVSQKASQVVGIEENQASIHAAKGAVQGNKINNVQFTTGDASLLMPVKIQEGFDTVIVDPPRKGMEAGAVEILKKAGIKRLIYVSCNPNTLVRDIRLLSPALKLISVQGVDMFPHTEHVETVAVLDKAD